MRAEISNVKGRQFYILSDQIILLPETTAYEFYAFRMGQRSGQLRNAGQNWLRYYAARL